MKRLNDVKLYILNEGEDWRPEGARAPHSLSDPTSSRAIYVVDELGDKLTAARAEESELEDFIGVSLAIIEGVRDGFGEIYAILLDARYIDGMTWAAIHEEYGVVKSSGHYLLGIAFDWIDSVGVSRLLKGEVEV